MNGRRQAQVSNVHPGRTTMLDRNAGVGIVPGVMSAAVYRGSEGVVLERVPVPEIGDGEILRGAGG